MVKNINTKLNETSESINKKLILNGYSLVNNNFIVRVYFVSKKLSIKSYADLKRKGSYVILEDNMGKKRIILNSNGELYGTIEGLNSAKELIKLMNYKEVGYVNDDTSTYILNNFKLFVHDIKDQGIFVTVEDSVTIDELLELFDNIDIKYDKSNLYANNIDIAIKMNSKN